MSGKWVRARYVVKREVIEQNYAEFEITGPAEIRDVIRTRITSIHGRTHGRQGAGQRRKQAAPTEKDPPSKHPPVKEPKQIGAQCEHEPQVDQFERILVLLFLRRYITYRARRARFAQMNGAAPLHREVAALR